MGTPHACAQRCMCYAAPLLRQQNPQCIPITCWVAFQSVRLCSFSQCVKRRTRQRACAAHLTSSMHMCFASRLPPSKGGVASPQVYMCTLLSPQPLPATYAVQAALGCHSKLVNLAGRPPWCYLASWPAGLQRHKCPAPTHALHVAHNFFERTLLSSVACTTDRQSDAIRYGPYLCLHWRASETTLPTCTSCYTLGGWAVGPNCPSAAGVSQSTRPICCLAPTRS